jgi:hypothetical protein
MAEILHEEDKSPSSVTELHHLANHFMAGETITVPITCNDPMLSQLQSWPQAVLSRYLMGRSLNLVSIALFIIWLVVFGVVLASSNSRNRESSVGQSSIRLACDAQLW